MRVFYDVYVDLVCITDVVKVLILCCWLRFSLSSGYITKSFGVVYLVYILLI